MQQDHLPVSREVDIRAALSVIRKIAYRHSRAQHSVNLEEFREALRYLEISPEARQTLAEKVGGIPNPVSQQARLDTEGFTDPENLLNFDHETSMIIAEMCGIWGQFFSVYEQDQQTMTVQQKYYRCFKETVNSLPGQSAAAADIAVLLTRQITAKEKYKPATLLLHGQPDGGLSEMATALATTLQKEAGFDTLTIDLAQLRNEGESASLDGSPSYWAGSKPGLVTQQIYNHPRSVIIFENIDQPPPAVQAALMPALKSGFMVDNFGLDELDQRHKSTGQASTEVDCRQAVFIFTASTGSEWSEHKDAAALFDDRTTWQAAMVEEMAQATREQRGKTQSRVHRPLLNHLAPHLVSLGSITWQERQSHTDKELHAALETFSNETGWQLVTDQLASKYLATLHLLKHPTLHVSAMQRRFILQQLLEPLCHTLFEQPTPGKAKILISPAGYEPLQAWLDQHAHDPVKALRQRQLSFTWSLKHTYHDSTLVFEFDDVRAVRAHRLQDYQGTIALQARVPDVAWDDVAGHQQAKAFLEQVASLIIDPTLNPADLPRGTLLSGPPGTGKTMLAKAFAARCELPFIAVAGTDLLNPNRIDELYRLARKEAPCVIFIDEADALGTRGAKSASHDAAITKLLTEIQGFSPAAPIFHILTSNLPDELDPALLRPQRIDQHFHLGSLDPLGRQTLLKQQLPSLDDASLRKLVERSRELSGAQLQQLCRQLRLFADDAQPTPRQIDDAVLTFRHGSLAQDQPDAPVRHRIACHEAGHAIVHHACFPEHSLELLSIEARGDQGGIMICSQDDHPFITKQSLLSRMTVSLAGRAAELEIYGNGGLSTGAISDLALATKLAWHAVSEAGLDEVVGPISVPALPFQAPLLLNTLHERVQIWLSQAETQATELIRQNIAAHEQITNALIKHNRLVAEDIAAIFSKLESNAKTQHAATKAVKNDYVDV